MDRARAVGTAMAVLAAALFGASFPLSKPLLRHSGPVALAGLFYIGCGLGAAALLVGRRLRGRAVAEAPLRWSDAKWLAAATFSGGVAAPALLLSGLERTPAHVAAFLTNAETLFTVLLAVLFFGDRLARREVLGTAVILVGATLVALGGAEARGALAWEGPLLLLGAGLGWGLDNNFTQRISARDPLQIAVIKGLVAGTVNLALASAAGAPPSWTPAFAASAFAVGFGCYGLSLAFFVIALRHLGAARTSSLFATNPAMAALLAWAMLGEIPRGLTVAGGLLMIPGAWLLVRPRPGQG